MAASREHAIQSRGSPSSSTRCFDESGEPRIQVVLPLQLHANHEIDRRNYEVYQQSSIERSIEEMPNLLFLYFGYRRINHHGRRKQHRSHFLLKNSFDK